MWGRCKYLAPLWLTHHIKFHRVVLQGREGIDAQAAKLISGDMLLRIPHEATNHMHRAEVDHALGRNYGYHTGSHYPKTVYWLSRNSVVEWDPSDQRWFHEDYMSPGISTLFVSNHHKGGYPMPDELRDYVNANSEFPFLCEHFADYMFTHDLIHLAQKTHVMWSHHGFITKYALLGPDHMEEAIKEAEAIHQEERLTPRKG